MTRTAEPLPDAPDSRMRTTIVTVGVVGAGTSLAALVVFGPRLAFSVAIGAALALSNLWALARIMAPMFQSSPPAGSRGAQVLLVVPKMLGLVAIAWLLMRQGVVSPMPMLVGFGSLPIGIVIGSLVSDRSAPGQAGKD